jgi:hypothetical protein
MKIKGNLSERAEQIHQTFAISLPLRSTLELTRSGGPAVLRRTAGMDTP